MSSFFYDGYYLNENAQITGEHEVHRSGCEWLKKAKKTIYLGPFGSCHVALKEARNHYDNVDGCKYCCPECHTK